MRNKFPCCWKFHNFLKEISVKIRRKKGFFGFSKWKHCWLTALPLADEGYVINTNNLVPRAFLVVARELRKTLVKYDEISKILGDLSHAQ